MPNAWLLFASFASLVVAILLILGPDVLRKLSVALNRSLTVADDSLLRYRHVLGVIAFLASYGLFRLSLLYGVWR